MATTNKSVSVICLKSFTDVKTHKTHTPSKTAFQIDAALAEKRAKAGLVKIVTETK